MFFLFIVCIQQIPGVSPTSRYTTAIPLTLVLIVAAVKEIMEDLKRHRMDNEVNNRLCKVLSGSSFIEKPWRNVCVGDIVRVEDKQFFPADLILLSSSEPDALCYIETSNLDGETNLKVRQGIPDTAALCSPEEIAALDGVLKSEHPNNSLYTYEGTLTYRGKELPLDPLQLLLRGAQLRNSRWVYAAVINTGHETKLMRSATAAPLKQTRVEKMMNVQIFFLFVILVGMAGFSSLANRLSTLNNPFVDTFINFPMVGRPPVPATFSSFIRTTLTFVILYNNLIPISLVVTVEFVRLLQSRLINADLDLYHRETDTPAVVRTSSLVEELGQIEFIFSDKTGTLTCNQMEFKIISAGGRAYTQYVPENKKAKLDDRKIEMGFRSFDELQSALPDLPIAREFLTLLAVCHTVIPEYTDDGKLIYQASSPDEGALVKGARQLGYTFTTRRPRSVTIKLPDGREEEYEILNICEFNSTRKRMSAIVRTPTGEIKLYTKGADTVILERLDKKDSGFVDSTLAHLESYAEDGLRTLCIAYRIIPSEEYEEWSKVFEKAATTISNRQEELDKAAELIEKNMFLLGATAIEDRLQDGVPDTIYTLSQAGIRLWVLTGDRQETAINIGYSCKLITEDMNLIVINQETHHATLQLIQRKLEAVKRMNLLSQMPTFHQTGGIGGRKKRKQKLPSSLEQGNSRLALIIDGKSLDYALEKDVEPYFLELSCYCRAVICCRVSPLQKALVVKMVKRNVLAVLLAIGDGANDVSMIQAAHIGVGISGMEGLQAARSADVAISQFSYLRKLLLVHGSWSYVKTSKLILFSFYKNVTLYLTQFWFAADSLFSGQTLFESWILTLYNAVFTVFPPFVMGIFDNYINVRMLDHYPQLYTLGQNGEFFNVRRFWGSFVNAVFHSIIAYYFVRAIYGPGTVLDDGTSGGNWYFGIAVYAVVLAIVNIKAAILTNLWVSFTFAAIVGSFGLFLFTFPIYSTLLPLLKIAVEYRGFATKLYGNAFFWMCIILVPTACVIRDLVYKFYRRMYGPGAYHIVQEIQKFSIPDYRPRMEVFRKAVNKVRLVQRLKKNRGYAFSQNESGQAELIRVYDTTRRKPRG